MNGTLALVLAIVTGAMPCAQELTGLGLQLLVDIPSPPIPVPADGRVRLVYELHLTNADKKPIELQRVEVWERARVAAVEGAELARAITTTGVDEKETRTIRPGAHAVVLLWLSLDAAPREIRHRLVGVSGGASEPAIVEYPAIQIRRAPVRIAPPLRGDRWLAANGPANATHHRRSWLAHNGRAFFPERFAIDSARHHDLGLTTGDPAPHDSYRGYGAEAIAVADARVATVKEGIAENVPANRPPSGPTLETMGGNLVVLDLGSGRYAFYAHLQPGSIRVKTGDHVRVGQVLGLVGNSGNSNAPHLHFQISDRPSLLLSEGIPFVIDSFVHDGKTKTDEIPLENWVVSFR
jgi:murein DD-endopeptidase MepM/ murein hydrolase activator NlpD